MSSWGSCYRNRIGKPWINSQQRTMLEQTEQRGCPRVKLWTWRVTVNILCGGDHITPKGGNVWQRAMRCQVVIVWPLRKEVWGKTRLYSLHLTPCCHVGWNIGQIQSSPFLFASSWPLFHVFIIGSCFVHLCQLCPDLFPRTAKSRSNQIVQLDFGGTLKEGVDNC